MEKNHSVEKIFLTAKELSEKVPLSVQTIKKYARLGDLPGKIFGRKWIFNFEMVAKVLNGQQDLNESNSRHRLNSKK